MAVSHKIVQVDCSPVINMSVSHTLDNVIMNNVNVLINKFIAIATFDICSIHSLRPEKFRDAMSTSVEHYMKASVYYLH